MSLKDTQMERLVHYQPLWGNWQVGKKIGNGSFGNVYLLHDYNEIEPPCVLKVITIEYDRNMRNYGYTKQSYLEYALNAKKEEIRIHARLSACPNIVSYQNYAVEKIYDENHELEGYDMLMRMEKLRALNDWQDDGNQLDEAGLIRLATHICRALRDGGMCGERQRGGRLVHRDIKPANIYVSQFGEFKLGDFGESRIDVTHSIMSYHGTPLYMAPEIYRHERSYHPNIDLYSLGIVLYEIANDGVMPFFDPSKGYEAMADALDERMSGTPVPKLTGVSAALAEIIAKAVEFDSQNRWQSAEDMLAALEQCGKRPQTAPETARTRSMDKTEQETARTRSMDKTVPETERTHPEDQTVPLLRKTQPLDADELCRRAKAAYEDKKYQEAVRLFRLSADAGNAEAMYQLGDCYCYGWGVDKDRAQAAVWYRKGAEAGSAQAMVGLGKCYLYGRGVDADNTQAVKWYRKAAEAGNGEAMYELGKCYLYGRGVDADNTQAVKWYRKAAEAGNGAAMYELGNCYYLGWGVDADRAQAVEWYQKAVRAGGYYGELAEDILNKMREKGLIGRKTQPLDVDEADELLRRAKAAYAGKNYQEAVRLFRLSADAGNAEAMYKLGDHYFYGMGYGKCYLYGKGVDKDEAQAKEWYQKAVRLFRLSADAGNAEAMYWLGKCYLYGKGVDKDEAQAVVWYRKAAEAGDTEAMYQLGDCYHYGRGVDKDKAQAVVWYRKAADAGNAKAMYELGYCYQNGEGVDKDYAQAAVWYRKGAESGKTYAMVKLGDCYLHGRGVDKDEAQAVVWYRKGAEAGDTEAMYNLGYCYEHGEGVDEDKAHAVVWYRKGAEAGNALTMFLLGECYQHGKGVDQDYAQAAEWYQKAARADIVYDSPAEDRLNEMRKQGLI